MKTIHMFSLSLIAAATQVAAEVPHTFNAGEKAIASQVNENFSFLDERISTLEDLPDGGDIEDLELRVTTLEDQELDSRISTIESQNLGENLTALEGQVSDIDSQLGLVENALGQPQKARPLAPYTPKTANIGDVVGTIGEVDYVLAAFPFREFGTGTLYKVTMPIKRFECSEDQSPPWAHGQAMPCQEGMDYVYDQKLYLTHRAEKRYSTEEFLISGFPAYFIDSVIGDESTISISQRQVYEEPQPGDDPFPPIHTQPTVINNLSVRSSLPLFKSSDLYLQVGETELRFFYTNISSGNKVIGHSKDITEDSLDFTEQLSAEELNDLSDQTLHNQYRDLYNYISIEELTP